MATPPPLKQKFPRNPSSLSFWGFTLGSHPGRVQRANHCNKTTSTVNGRLSRCWDNLRKASRVMQTPPAVCGKIPICNFIPRSTRSEATYQLVEILVGGNFGKKTCGEFGGLQKAAAHNDYYYNYNSKSLVPKNCYTQKHHHSTNTSSNSKRNV